jgi:photosystem II stability/assembly factor-like uncharacterized protein
MHSNFKFRLAIALILIILSGCRTIKQAPPSSTAVPTSSTPAMINTAPLLPKSQTPAPPTTAPNMYLTRIAPTIVQATQVPVLEITSLTMLDADNGWAYTNSGRLLRTSDGGQTWMDRTPGEAVGPEGSFFLDSQTAWQPVFLKSLTTLGLLRTRDGGQTWTQISFGPQNPIGQAAILQFTDALNGWAESGDVGAGSVLITLSQTRDGGKSWAPMPVKSPLPEPGLPAGTFHLCNICEDRLFYDPERILIVYGEMGSSNPSGSVRLQVSFDQGNTWNNRSLPLPANKNYTGVDVNALNLTLFNDRNGLLPVHLIKWDNNGSLASSDLVFYSTQDGGASWSLLPGILDDVGVFPQIQVTSRNIILALCGNTLCLTQDGAVTWHPLATNLDFSQTDKRSVLALDFVDAGTGWTLIQENGSPPTLYQTKDGGRSWAQISPQITTSTPVVTNLDERMPTLTRVPNPTFPTPAP